ncbi:hypothetical protein ACIBCT_35095 [Streptosporangium sp. NPDC050855]|uniref:hypothetical protein n=1 Tax=Streptosporangium sp. NPDC050855 TaxID=3366194 RepID=UPI0037AB4635
MGEVEEKIEDPQVAKWHKAAKIYKEKRSLADVGKEMGVHESTVRYYLANLGFKDMRPQGDRTREDVTDELIVELREGGLSFAQIGAQVGMSKAGVHARYMVITTGERPSDATRPVKKRMKKDAPKPQE